MSHGPSSLITNIKGASGKLLEEIAGQQAVVEEDPVELLLTRLLALIDLDREVAGDDEWTRLYARIEQFWTSVHCACISVVQEISKSRMAFRQALRVFSSSKHPLDIWCSLAVSSQHHRARRTILHLH